MALGKTNSLFNSLSKRAMLDQVYKSAENLFKQKFVTSFIGLPTFSSVQIKFSNVCKITLPNSKHLIRIVRMSSCSTLQRERNEPQNSINDFLSVIRATALHLPHRSPSLPIKTVFYVFTESFKGDIFSHYAW